VKRWSACSKTSWTRNPRHTPRDCEAQRELAVNEWPESAADVTAFWTQGQLRARTYEAALASLLPGYNTGSEGFLAYRPDLVVAPFRPCSIVAAVSDDQAAINAAIRRDAQVCEFTAINSYSAAAIRDYMASELSTTFR
jgi:hypothetical protein